MEGVEASPGVLGFEGAADSCRVAPDQVLLQLRQLVLRDHRPRELAKAGRDPIYNLLLFHDAVDEGATLLHLAEVN